MELSRVGEFDTTECPKFEPLLIWQFGRLCLLEDIIRRTNATLFEGDRLFRCTKVAPLVLVIR